MTTEITKPEEMALFQPGPSVGKEPIAPSGAKEAWIPRLELAQSKSKVVEDMQIAQSRDYVFNREENLGQTIHAVLIAARNHAMQFDDSFDNVIAGSFNPQDEEYQRIKALADRKGQTENCCYGREVLVFILDNQKFATFHFNGKISRPVGEKVTNPQTERAAQVTADNMKKVQEQHQGTPQELWPKLAQCYVGGLLEQAAQWSSDKVSHKFGVTWRPTLTFLPPQIWVPKFGQPVESEVKAAIDMFSDLSDPSKTVPPNEESVEGSVDR